VKDAWVGSVPRLGAILASVFAGLGITLLLVAFGSAAGIEAADDGGDETWISSIVGTWTVISALLGTFIGTFIGGRYSRFQSGASAVYHALTSWGFVRLCLRVIGTRMTSAGVRVAPRGADQSSMTHGGYPVGEGRDGVLASSASD
jgi:hypothetical protein